MNWIKKLFTRHPSPVTLHDPAWAEKQRAMFAVMGSLPDSDALMTGLIAWQDARLAGLVSDCTNPRLTAEEALTLVHRIAEVRDFREALDSTWRQQRALALEAKAG
jgi:hypothetical protein